MKIVKTGLLSLLGLLVTASIALAQGNVDASNSQVNWNGYKVTGSHNGTINIKDGNLDVKDGKLVGGFLVIDMTSLAVTDLQGGMADKLSGHLKSADFFDVENHNTAKLQITNVADRGPNEFKVTGDLTIKGITKPIKFNVKNMDGKMDAKITIDRSEYNVRYGSGSFFDNLGDKTIYDEFDLNASITLK